MQRQKCSVIFWLMYLRLSLVHGTVDLEHKMSHIGQHVDIILFKHYAMFLQCEQENLNPTRKM